MGDPLLPPGCSDNDPYFHTPNAKARRYKYPAKKQCEVCNAAPIYIRHLETKLWHCLDCAFKAGEPTAAIWKAHKATEELLKPAVDLGKVA